MPLSKTEIANQALAGIGATTIMDIASTEVQNARVVSNVFRACVEELSREHKWNCLMTRANLAQLSAAPAFGWSYQYALPTECIRLVKLNGYDIADSDGEHWTRRDKFAVEGRNILTNAEEAKIEYVKYEADSTKYDSLFTRCLVALVESRISIAIRQDEQLAFAKMQEYRRVLGSARRIDGNERRTAGWEPARESRWNAARRFSTNG